MVKPLTAQTIKHLRRPGEYADGNGLYLKVAPGLTKSWVFRYQRNGRRQKMGLGSLSDLSLKEAREELKKHRKVLRESKDPIQVRNARVRDIQVNQQWTFENCANTFVSSNQAAWKNSKHNQQWRNTLQRYAFPVLGHLPVEDIAIDHILEVLKPIWETKTETASRLRGRMERILSWSIVMGYRDHPNPAIWRGTLDQILPKPSKVAKQKHHPALPYQEIDSFYARLNEVQSVSASALRVTILNGCRISETLGATWDEIDEQTQVWIIPAGRMKGEREHRIPFSDQVAHLLEILPKENRWLFPSPQQGKHISDTSLRNVLKRRLNRTDVTIHGFRTTLRDWVAEQTNYSWELGEMALAHKFHSKTEAAYQRGDMLDKRRLMMQEWADYCYLGRDPRF